MKNSGRELREFYESFFICVIRVIRVIRGRHLAAITKLQPQHSYPLFVSLEGVS